MARKSRIHVPGGVYHVMLRGNGGQAIFPDPDDGARFLDLLAEGTERFGFRCHGYCLMTGSGLYYCIIAYRNPLK